jgi:ATP-dependent Zn protease
LESKNADQDKEIGNIKSDITTLDTSIKNVASDVKTLDGNIKKVDDKAEAAGKKADEANQKNVIQDNNSFWTAVIISLIVLVALGFALAAFFRRQHNNNQLQGQQNQAGNQNNGQQFQNGFGYQQPGQNPQVIGPFWGTAPQFHLQWGLPTVVGNNQNQQQPVPANPPVGNNP